MKSLPRALRLLARLSAATALVTLVACGGDSDSTGSSGGNLGGSAGCKTGGNAPYASPAGTPFTLPAGVTLENGEGTGDISNSTCGQRAKVIEYAGDMLPVCLTFLNATDADITFTLPAGLTFLPKEADGQNGIMWHDHVLVVPAGKPLHVRLNLACVNEHCKFGRSTDRYVFGNVTNDPKLLELIALAAKVNFGDATDGNDDRESEVAYTFQQALWEITGGGSISDKNRQAIAGLPPRS